MTNGVVLKQQNLGENVKTTLLNVRGTFDINLGILLHLAELFDDDGIKHYLQEQNKTAKPFH